MTSPADQGRVLPTLPVDRPAGIEPLSLFPTMGSLQDVHDYARSKLPITSPNDIASLLAVYHNTLLHLMEGKPHVR